MGEYKTESEVRVLIQLGLENYEAKIVEPRHKETQADLRDLKRMFWALILLVITSLAVGITTLATRSAQSTVTHSDLY